MKAKLHISALAAAGTETLGEHVDEMHRLRARRRRLEMGSSSQ